jgi:hypothetical protein
MWVMALCGPGDDQDKDKDKEKEEDKDKNKEQYKDKDKHLRDMHEPQTKTPPTTIQGMDPECLENIASTGCFFKERFLRRVLGLRPSPYQPPTKARGKEWQVCG